VGGLRKKKTIEKTYRQRFLKGERKRLVWMRGDLVGAKNYHSHQSRQRSKAKKRGNWRNQNTISQKEEKRGRRKKGGAIGRVRQEEEGRCHFEEKEERDEGVVKVHSGGSGGGQRCRLNACAGRTVGEKTNSSGRRGKKKERGLAA